MDTSFEACWARALDAYARPGVADACLALQDEYGVCVPTLLCLCDLAACGEMIEPAAFAAVDASVAAWRRDVVGSLRKVRRAMKARPLSAGDATLYAELKAVELNAEKALMAALMQRLRERARPLGAQVCVEACVAAIAALLPGAPQALLTTVVGSYKQNPIS